MPLPVVSYKIIKKKMLLSALLNVKKATEHRARGLCKAVRCDVPYSYNATAAPVPVCMFCDGFTVPRGRCTVACAL